MGLATQGQSRESWGLRVLPVLLVAELPPLSFPHGRIWSWVLLTVASVITVEQLVCDMAISCPCADLVVPADVSLSTHLLTQLPL